MHTLYSISRGGDRGVIKSHFTKKFGLRHILESWGIVLFIIVCLLYSKLAGPFVLTWIFSLCLPTTSAHYPPERLAIPVLCCCILSELTKETWYV